MSQPHRAACMVETQRDPAPAVVPMRRFPAPFTMLAATVACLCQFAHPAHARTARYTYTGTAYTEFRGGNCLTASMHGSFTMILSAPLAPNLSYATVSPTFWRSSNGINHFKSTSPQDALVVQVSTDGNGAITAWIVEAQSTGAKGASAFYSLNGNGGVGDLGFDGSCKAGQSEALSAVPGSWTH